MVATEETSHPLMSLLNADALSKIEFKDSYRRSIPIANRLIKKVD